MVCASGLLNFYDSEIGNPQLPKKLQAIKKHRTRVRWAEMAVALLMLAAIVAAFVFLLRRPGARPWRSQKRALLCFHLKI